MYTSLLIVLLLTSLVCTGIPLGLAIRFSAKYHPYDYVSLIGGWVVLMILYSVAALNVVLALYWLQQLLSKTSTGLVWL